MYITTDVTVSDGFKSKLTVGDLRKALEGHPDDLPVMLEIDSPQEGSDLTQAYLRQATVESRCDEQDACYLWGSYGDDVQEACDAEMAREEE